MSATPKAVCLLSGGMDSAVALAEAALSHEVHAITFDYGQVHRGELRAAAQVAEAAGVASHREVAVEMFDTSPLTGAGEIPTGGAGREGVAPTYVPARNLTFLSLALGWAETIGAYELYLGASAPDHAGYPDCRREFFQAFESIARWATAAGTQDGASFVVRAPLLWLSKGAIIRRAAELGVDLSLTHTCYRPVGDLACGVCDACRLRLQGYEEVGIADPLKYA